MPKMLPKNFNPTLGIVKPRLVLRDPQIIYNVLLKRIEYVCSPMPYATYVVIAVRSHLE